MMRFLGAIGAVYLGRKAARQGDGHFEWLVIGGRYRKVVCRTRRYSFCRLERRTFTTGGKTEYGIQFLFQNWHTAWINGAVDVSNDFGSVMGWLTHNNEVISQDFLGTVNIHYHLDYYSDPEKTNLVWAAPEMDFVLQIWETPNAAPCDPEQTEDTTCDDRFRYQVLGATGFGDPFDLPLGSFTYDGTNYVVTSSGFYDAAGTLLGTAWSGEELSNTFYVNHEVHVPEPASIALMGLGLLGLGVARRRKQLLKA